MNHYVKAYLLMNPGLRGLIEWSFLIGSGIAGLFLPVPRLPGFPLTAFLGGLLFIGGFIFHVVSERVHREAHHNVKIISHIIDTGMYGKIRHPLYLSLIIMDIGVGIGFGVYWTLGLSFVFSVLYVLTALVEEQFLLQSFRDEYTAYTRKVPWRIIPGLF